MSAFLMAPQAPIWLRRAHWSSSRQGEQADDRPTTTATAAASRAGETNRRASRRRSGDVLASSSKQIDSQHHQDPKHDHLEASSQMFLRSQQQQQLQRRRHPGRNQADATLAAGTNLMRDSRNWRWANSVRPLTMLLVALAAALLLAPAPGQASMCQYHQAYLEAQQQHQPQHQKPLPSPSGPSTQQQQQHPNLIVCPKASQFNNLPLQFQSINSKVLATPAFERQQREILKSLNASFAQHMTPPTLNGGAMAMGASASSPQAAAGSNEQLVPSDLIDDELLNEIISPLIVDEAYERAKKLIVERRKLETDLIKQGFVTDMSKPTAVARHQRVTTTTTRGNELEKSQEVFDEMSRILSQNLTNTLNMRMLSSADLQAARLQLGQASQLGNGRGATAELPVKPTTAAAAAAAETLEVAASEQQLLERSDTNQLLSRIDLHLSEARHAATRCEEDQAIQCDPNFPYRHADGRCNNLQKPTWGKANTCFARLLPPDYSDGQGAPRISVTGHPLPNPRILSAIVHRDFNYPATYTHFVMQYGQFFAHDIAFTPSSRTKSGSMIQCCPIERDSHPQCFPILVPPDDPFYSNWEESCLNFVRTAICPRCRLGPREQMNQITSFVDGSQVYGSAANETAALWTKSGPAGRMHVSFDDAGRELLPHSADPGNDQCSDVEKGQFCYRAGDRRVNQHPALTAVHTIWLRQHNRIVNGLKMINPHWNGDRLYQEAKRISTAQMQMVTYNEWLSLIIGQEAMKFLKLNVLPSGYTKYDPTVDPSLLNEFSGAAFRFGHSMINNIFAEILPDGRPSGYRLNEFFFHPFGLKAGQHDMVMRGLISQASQNRDPFVSSDIKNHLYRPRDNPYGLDLPAFNIQRGRDHGIPGYTKLVEFCFDDTITNWKQLDQYMPVSQRIRFSKLYRSVHDLDLFSAGLAEYPLPGAALGPTFTCIVGIQMFNLKYGDRFWFEHGQQVGSFTPDQLQEVRKSNLARLVCVNSDNISVIQKNVFRGESPANPSVPCNSLPDTDLRAWKEDPGVRSIFSDAADQMGREEDQNSIQNGDGRPMGKKKRQQQQQQEPLAYAFRSQPRPQAQPSLGSDYGMPPKAGPHPPAQGNHMMMKQQQQQQQQPQGYNKNNEHQAHNNNNNQGYGMSPAKGGGSGGGGGFGPNQPHYQALIKQGQVRVTMSNTYGAPMRGGGGGSHGPNMKRPPFGMPVAPRAPPSRHRMPQMSMNQNQHQLRHQQYSQQRSHPLNQAARSMSSPALTFDQILQYSQQAG